MTGGKNELQQAIYLRDLALSFILAIGKEQEFIQHLGLVVKPNYHKEVEKKCQELANLYLRQQELYRMTINK